ncbi:non-canonical purine NTP pyrophosphatase [uncultured Treponema sp.]|uniref:non-canonical purine NTP pyrophosphatase n=1 Tax=uncultured Treponema sp. TaxID=162155 RepID=UPI00259807F8|nr:non-canonical purine NTP pyrophosphatase [uncultured Treponema sp.]
MEEIKLLYGTGNPAKLNAMKKRLSRVGITLVGLKDLGGEIPEVAEDGKTPLENARKKAVAYFEAFRIPVFSCDSGLYIDGVPENEQPGVHVRRVNGKVLSDEQMIVHYSSLAKKYGNPTARYRNAICFVEDEKHIYEAMEPFMGSSAFVLTSKPYPVMKKGFPLDSLSVDIKTGKYYYEFIGNELDRLAVEDGFAEFFRKILFEKKN